MHVGTENLAYLVFVYCSHLVVLALSFRASWAAPNLIICEDLAPQKFIASTAEWEKVAGQQQ